jgi:hypothetical protein
VSFDIPTLPKSLTAASIGTVQGRILEKNLVSGGMTSVYYELNVLDKDYSNVVESVKPDAVDVYGGGLVTVTIYKFNNGIAVTAAQTRVLFGTSEATVLSVVSSSTRTTPAPTSPRTKQAWAGNPLTAPPTSSPSTPKSSKTCSVSPRLGDDPRASLVTQIASARTPFPHARGSG